MKRRLTNKILAASVVAACVSCSRNSHLYYVVAGGGNTYVANIYEHQWLALQGSCGFIQFRVPYDASGKEAHDSGQKITHWRTYTDIFIPGHSLEFRGPAWLAGVIGSSILASIAAAILHVASRRPKRYSPENDLPGEFPGPTAPSR